MERAQCHGLTQERFDRNWTWGNAASQNALLETHLTIKSVSSFLFTIYNSSARNRSSCIKASTNGLENNVCKR